MTPWTDLFRRPRRLTEKSAAAWFANIADQLLNKSQLMIAGKSHRLVDIEFYYRGPGHFDPFAHAHPMQAESGRWYLHRTGRGYRGGTFKGLDLTFGDGESRGGNLFRAAETSNGARIDGPSLLVDHALRLSQVDSVAALDNAIAERSAWQSDCPIQLSESAGDLQPILSCARVGLFLRRAGRIPEMPTYLAREYRFLTDPKRTRKGKTSMVVAMHRRGLLPEQILSLTGCPMRAIERYVAAYASGRIDGRFEEHFGRVLTSTDLCRVYGIADRN